MKNKPIIIQDSVNYGIGINSPTEELNSLEKAENIEAVARIIFRHEYPTEDTAIIFLKDFIKAELSAQLNTFKEKIDELKLKTDIEMPQQLDREEISYNLALDKVLQLLKDLN